MVPGGRIDQPSESGADPYLEFLKGKMKLAGDSGFVIDPAEIHPWCRPHVRALIPWMIRGGRRALFAAFGLHKTSAQLEALRLIRKHQGGHALNVIPLGVRADFRREAANLDLTVKFIRSPAEIDPAVDVHLTNYETVRDGKLDPNLFTAVSLDEASVLRSYGSKTYQEFLPLFDKVRFRFVATATPSPNRYKELIHYAGFLGIMDTGQALTRFFQRNSEKANELTLYPHKEDEFWCWMHSWALFIQKPSDLGFSDEGYILPPLKVRWHEVQTDHAAAGTDRDGQGLMFRNTALGVTSAAAEKRDSLGARIAKMTEIIAADPEPHRLLWHDLESERHAIEKSVPGVRCIFGSQDIDINERHVVDFQDGKFRHLATKPEMSGSGCNFQRHCHKAIFLGIGFKFNDFIQAVYRIQRFGQTLECEIDIIYSEAERDVRRSLEDKWAQDDALRQRMSEIIRRYGLDQLPIAEILKRSIGIERLEARGENFCVVNNDCVDEARRQADESVDQIVTSIPFANHYEYTASYNDFGHTDDNAHFWAQMDHLTPQLLRILKPGRLACIHVKDRILFGSVTGAGVPTVSPFHAEAIFHYRRHGFAYMGMIHINTDVVRENNQTYRLGYDEMCKDSTKMGVGCPEYVLLMRKPQSDRSRNYADLPVTKWNEMDNGAPPDGVDRYSLARWQVDAHAFWRSSGDRLLTADELAQMKPNALVKAFTERSLKTVYDYHEHYRIGEQIEARRPGALPRIFMALAPGAHDPETWHDVNRMRTLNGAQAAAGREQHVCPFQLDIVERLIARYSNKGDLIYDPFGGIMSVPYCAILAGRRGYASELHTPYFHDGVRYLEQAERKMAVPSLFAMLDSEHAA